MPRQTPLSTADLLRLVESYEHTLDLVPVGISLHTFTEPLRLRSAISMIDLHRATAVLSKQVQQVLTGDRPLDAIRELVTDPARLATADGRGAASLCGDAWPAVRALADERARAAIEGAVSFGEIAILRLAATRAAVPTCTWWGTAGWLPRVTAWAATEHPAHDVLDTVLLTPEAASDEVLLAILDR